MFGPKPQFLLRPLGHLVIHLFNYQGVFDLLSSVLIPMSKMLLAHTKC